MDALNLKTIKSEQRGKSTEQSERDWIFDFLRRGLMGLKLYLL